MAPNALAAGHRRRGTESKEGATRYADWQIKMHTCLCREVLADHEAQSQDEARRSDDSCESDVSTHESVTAPSLGRDAHPDAKARA